MERKDKENQWYLIIASLVVLSLFVSILYAIISINTDGYEPPKLGQDNPPITITHIEKPVVCGNNICEKGEYNGTIIYCSIDCWAGLTFTPN